MVALILVLMLRVGMEFFGILILIGIAAAMTFVILGYEEKQSEEDKEEIETLRASVKSLEEKIERLNKLLEE